MKKHHWDYRMTITLSFLIISIGFIVIGPSYAMGFTAHLSMRIIGWVIIGIAKVLFDVVSLSEVVRSVHLKSGLNLDNPVLNERAEYWHQIFCGIGAILGPIVGAGTL
jgi:hypothetical protein